MSLAITGALPRSPPGSSGDLGCPTDGALWQRLGIDKCVLLGARHPREKEDTWHLPSLFSLFGIETRLIEYGDGLGVYEEIAKAPLAKAETISAIDSCPWPDAWDFDYAGLRVRRQLDLRAVLPQLRMLPKG